MDNIKNLMDNHKCNICNKIYSSYKSLWNHNKEFHKVNNINVQCVQQTVQNVQQPVQNVQSHIQQNNKVIKSLTCELCNKIFNNRPAKSIHKKKCTEHQQEENNKIKQLEEINQTEIEDLKNTINELKKQVSSILEEKGKIHHKTLQKINNQLTNKINNQSNINTFWSSKIFMCSFQQLVRMT